MSMKCQLGFCRIAMGRDNDAIYGDSVCAICRKLMDDIDDKLVANWNKLSREEKLRMMFPIATAIPAGTISYTYPVEDAR